MHVLAVYKGIVYLKCTIKLYFCPSLKTRTNLSSMSNIATLKTYLTKLRVKFYSSVFGNQTEQLVIKNFLSC